LRPSRHLVAPRSSSWGGSKGEFEKEKSLAGPEKVVMVGAM
jgi:hypothetical protein